MTFIEKNSADSSNWEMECFGRELYRMIGENHEEIKF